MYFDSLADPVGRTRRAPPKGSDSFALTDEMYDILRNVVASGVGVPPPVRGGRPPTGNPGSATVIHVISANQVVTLCFSLPTGTLLMCRDGGHHLDYCPLTKFCVE